MNPTKRPHGYWTLETLRPEALKYAKRSEFQKMNGPAYHAAGRLKGYKRKHSCIPHVKSFSKEVVLHTKRQEQ